MMKNFVSRLLPASAFLLFAVAAHTQGTPTTVKDSSMLKPPAGYRVAIVEWEDLECPACSKAFPILSDEHEKTGVPWVQYDYPLGAMHPWSKDAAIYARWFDTKSPAIGQEFRARVFKAQMFLHPGNLRPFVDNFAKEKNLQVPFVVDPQGKLVALIDADHALGDKMGLNHTPTIFIVTDGKKAAPYTEILDPTQVPAKLGQIIAAEGGVKDTPSSKPAAKKTAAKK